METLRNREKGGTVDREHRKQGEPRREYRHMRRGEES
jgi:DNA-binding HxlR family transcriptional regulator